MFVEASTLQIFEAESSFCHLSKTKFSIVLEMSMPYFIAVAYECYDILMVDHHKVVEFFLKLHIVEPRHVIKFFHGNLYPIMYPL